MDAATRFCREPAYEGRLVVAASNGPQSCTLSGDVDAVVEAKQQLDAEQTSARQLLVDTASHSHHMQACAAIDVSEPRVGCVWNSSVRGDTQLLGRGGDSPRQVIESSIWHGGPWDLALEIGPHAALKGPTEQTLKAACGAAPPYASLLQRITSEVATFQTAVGLVWSQLGLTHVDFAGYRTIFGSCPPPTLSPVLARLPRYSWDHDKVYWRESRTSARYRTSPHSGHELLGRRVADDNERELRWRNVVRLDEIPWLRGHNVLGQVLLPGAAYVSIAAEAAQALAAITAPGLPVRQIAVEDLDLLRPLVVPDTKDGVESLFTVNVLSADTQTRSTGDPHAAGRPVLRARFAYYMCQNEATDPTCSLVGGPGGLGLSLCQWMIRQGARHIVITSRNPKVDPGLQKGADRAGESVRMLAMDATRRVQVVAAVNKVRETMLPIAGVCNLSMVLHDRMFLDMSVRQLNGTLKAKVLGAEILDDIFSSTDADAAHPPLDFLIFTSHHSAGVRYQARDDVDVVIIQDGDTVLRICVMVAGKWLAERRSREVKKEKIGEAKEVKRPAQPVPAPILAAPVPAPATAIRIPSLTPAILAPTPLKFSLLFVYGGLPWLMVSW
ncbi:hypothetical protein N0V95_006698 [Ascochyta clinopodiicola]|nr:hypothetical protein N0V95_006698 [Ascochyta clinopodiicola]